MTGDTAASHDWRTDIQMPDDDTQTLADVLAVMRENNLKRQAAFVEWIASEWYDLSAELQWRDEYHPEAESNVACICEPNLPKGTTNAQCPVHGILAFMRGDEAAVGVDDARDCAAVCDDPKRVGTALQARREGAECCDYRSFDYGNSCRCVLVEGHEGAHIV